MKSNAPWSVKGIERDARETAKEAAKREGMTVGEWLNQMIYTAGEPQDTGGEVEGLKLRDIVTAIDHLHKRIADSATETQEAVADVTRKTGNIVERVQRLERGGSGDRDRVDALKALEKAVAQVAAQFSNAQKSTMDRLDASEQSIQKLSERLSEGGGAGDDTTGVSHLKDAIDGLQTRMARTERLATQASEGGDPHFIESTDNRLRVLGDEIKRSGDQIRGLESTIVKLSEQIEAAERRSAEGVQKTAETLAELRENFIGGAGEAPNRDDIAALVSDRTRETEEKVDRLQSSFETMIARLDKLGAGGGESDPSAFNDSAEAAQEIKDDDDDIGEAFSDLELLDDEPALEGDADTEAKDALDELELHPDEEVSPAATNTAEAAAATDNDEDDDFFSFADDIDASIDDGPEAAATTASDDDFSFELDGDENEASAQEEQSGEAPVDTEGASILSEVQEAFAGTGGPAAKEENTADSDLDELLAGLDDLASDDDTDAAPTGQAVEENFSAEAADEAAPADNEKEDLLKSIRRKSREDTARAVEEETAKPKRRKLTPKQKAILVARARRKKLAEEAGKEEAPSVSDEEKRAAAKKALGAKKAIAEKPAEITQDENDDDDDAPSSGLGGKLGALRGKIPFLSGKKKADDEEDENVTAGAVSEEETDGDKAALDTLKGTASARPVTLALGVGIFLAAGLLFFMIKDFIFAPRDVSPAQQTAETTTTTTPGSASIVAPAPPAIDPNALYRDAMTGLNAAATDAESAVALEKLEQAAALGHPPAQLQLGELYKTGQGVDQDLTEARVWFRRAANGGNVLAMHRAGVMTARGEGGSASTPEAIAWFEQAANRGLVDSQYNLGAIYHPSGEDGAPGVQDAGKAYYWYSLAAQNGDTQAEPLAAGVGAALSTEQRAEIDEAVAAWEALPSDIEANTLAVSAG